jgi:hypothetical protein
LYLLTSAAAGDSHTAVNSAIANGTASHMIFPDFFITTSFACEKRFVFPMG